MGGQNLLNSQTIYCDESGFTGPHLSNKQQPFFVYASVALSPQKADEIVAKIIKDFRLQSKEIKGSKLLKSETGRNALSFLLKECLRESKSIMFNKRYSLACKIFENIFEPALSEKCAIFYGLGFHKFVSTLLFVELQTKSTSAEQLFEQFETLMRTHNTQGLAPLFSQRTEKRRTRSIAREVITFWHAQQKAVTEELSTIKSLGAVGRWILDLTDTALSSLLCYWGEKFDQLDVSCDESKPLFAHLSDKQNVFAAMIGRTDKQYYDFGNGPRCLTFNLARQISLLNSTKSSGIQIADGVAASLAFALQNTRNPMAREWLSMFDDSSAVHPDSNIPNLDVINVRKPHAARNRALFMELVKRCRNGTSLLENIEDFISFGWYRAARRRKARTQ